MFRSGLQVTPSLEWVSTVMVSTLESRVELTGSRVSALIVSSEPTT